MTAETYKGIGELAAIVTFICAWVYCIFAYGFLFGLGLGWLPAAFCAVAMRWLWPAAAVVAVLAVAVIAQALLQ